MRWIMTDVRAVGKVLIGSQKKFFPQNLLFLPVCTVDAPATNQLQSHRIREAGQAMRRERG